MDIKNSFSVGVRMFIVILGMGLIYSRFAQSNNQEETIYEVSPMISAAVDGDVTRLSYFLKRGDSVNAPDKLGSGPLSYATWNSQYVANQNAVDYLLRHQADVRARDHAGLSPLHTLTKIDVPFQRAQMIGKLIKFGATFDQADNRGFTLLDKTVETNSMTNVALLIDYWGRVLPFEVLQKAKKYAQTLFMGDVLNELEKGGKPMVVDAHWSPSDIDKRTGLNDFHCAVINGDRVLLKKMLDKKADINKASQDEYGLRPLHYAVLHRHVRTAEFLLENKAQVDGTDLDGNTPLHMLAWLSDHVIAKELAQVLLKFNANPSIKNKEGNTLLHLLIYTNNRDLIEEIGKIVVLRTDIQNNDRETAKDLAQRLKRQDLLKNINKK